jgi:hypothetical protein
LLPDSLATKRALEKLSSRFDRLNRQLAELFLPEQVEQTVQGLVEGAIRVDLVTTRQVRGSTSGAPLLAAR